MTSSVYTFSKGKMAQFFATMSPKIRKVWKAKPPTSHYTFLTPTLIYQA